MIIGFSTTWVKKVRSKRARIVQRKQIEFFVRRINSLMLAKKLQMYSFINLIDEDIASK